MAEVPAATGHPNAALIARFYTALDRHDAEAMVACYALGAKGVLLGWLPPVQGAVRTQAAKALAVWRAKDGPATGAQG